MAEQLTRGNDFNLKLVGFKNKKTGVFLNAATTRTWEITDLRDGSSVKAGTLDYMAASDGDYQKVIESTDFASLPVDCPYRITAVLEEGDITLERVIEGFVRRAGAGPA